MNQHDKFLGRLVASVDGVFAVAKWLHLQGYTITIDGMRKAPTAADADGFLDDGDIFAMKDEGPVRLLQVKRIGKSFSSRLDWPFGEVFVSSKAAVDRLAHVDSYLTLSHDMIGLVIVESKTRDKWYLVDRRASNTGNVETFYACPLADALFTRMDR